MRDAKNESKVGHLRKLFPKLELVEADLLKEGSFDEAFKDCMYQISILRVILRRVQNASGYIQ